MRTFSVSEVIDVIDEEGFDYGLRSYLTPDAIEDLELRDLVIKYCEAAEDVEEYLLVNGLDGTEGQDRESYTDTQDRESYTTTSEEDEDE